MRWSVLFRIFFSSSSLLTLDVVTQWGESLSGATRDFTELHVVMLKKQDLCKPAFIPTILLYDWFANDPSSSLSLPRLVRMEPFPPTNPQISETMCSTSMLRSGVWESVLRAPFNQAISILPRRSTAASAHCPLDLWSFDPGTESVVVVVVVTRRARDQSFPSTVSSEVVTMVVGASRCVVEWSKQLYLLFVELVILRLI